MKECHNACKLQKSIPNMLKILAAQKEGNGLAEVLSPSGDDNA
jgi:hypothetical protein